MKLKISPEGLELANMYLTCGSLSEAANKMYVSIEKATELINKPEIKRYIDTVYMDSGYRNRFKISNLLDEIIESKLAEARESEVYSSKDLVDILALVHKMKMEELKLEQSSTNIKNQTNVQINETPFGAGNYGKLMEKLLGKLTPEE